MCGIYVSIRDKRDARSEEEIIIDTELRKACALRGPDAQDSATIILGNLELILFASELHLRGKLPVLQPHRDPEGNILCWNGEVFNGFAVSEDENDGMKLFSALSRTRTSEDVIDLLAKIEGPYAMVYYQSCSRRLYVARDCLGRRSLLVHRPTPKNRSMFFASTLGRAMPDASIEELDSTSILCINADAWADQDDCMNIFEDYVVYEKRFESGVVHDYSCPYPINSDMPPESLPIIGALGEIPADLIDTVNELDRHFNQRLSDMIRNIPPSNNQARLAILFSGGIDSAALAYYAHRHVAVGEAIDLLNVAFENPRKTRSKAAKGETSIDAYAVPDRLSGLAEVAELQRVCLGRAWNFVHIDVPFEECQMHHSQVKTIIFPRNTVMDLSLANPLFFGARGRGYILEQGVRIPYTSNAKVLLSGLGADELLGGYGRHRTTFKSKSWQGLLEELQMELDRIPLRNLGRDDRVISSHGKECRHPFLSLDLVNYLATLPVHYKVDPRAAQGVGDKMLLRLLMHKVGLAEASSRHKKAMQFGSHSARMLGGTSDSKGHLLLSE